MGVQDIIPRLAVQSAGVVIATGMQPKSRAEIVAAALGGLPGAEIMFQRLLEIRAELGGPDQARAEREAPVREFHSPPVTYDGFGKAQRRPPAQTTYILA
jgi:hypothetical protein